jgi:hypothetical protein
MIETTSTLRPFHDRHLSREVPCRCARSGAPHQSVHQSSSLVIHQAVLCGISAEDSCQHNRSLNSNALQQYHELFCYTVPIKNVPHTVNPPSPVFVSIHTTPDLAEYESMNCVSVGHSSGDSLAQVDFVERSLGVLYCEGLSVEASRLNVNATGRVYRAPVDGNRGFPLYANLIDGSEVSEGFSAFIRAAIERICSQSSPV